MVSGIFTSNKKKFVSLFQCKIFKNNEFKEIDIAPSLEYTNPSIIENVKINAAFPRGKATCNYKYHTLKDFVSCQIFSEYAKAYQSN